MTRLQKSALILVAGISFATAGVQIASARGVWHDGPGRCWDAPSYSEKFTPEVTSMLEKSYAKMAPIRMELRAKQAELTAKIYQGADEVAIQRLTKEIADLQAKLTQGHVAVQKGLAEAGVPLGACPTPGFGGGFGPGKHGSRHWGKGGPGPDGDGPGNWRKQAPAPKAE